MTHQTTPETIATIGIDLGKNTFHLIGMDARGRIVLRRKVARGQLLQCLANRVGGNAITVSNNRNFKPLVSRKAAADDIFPDLLVNRCRKE